MLDANRMPHASIGESRGELLLLLLKLRVLAVLLTTPPSKAVRPMPRSVPRAFMSTYPRKPMPDTKTTSSQMENGLSTPRGSRARLGRMGTTTAATMANSRVARRSSVLIRRTTPCRGGFGASTSAVSTPRANPSSA